MSKNKVDKLGVTLSKGLSAILKRIESTEQFVLEQAPAVCKEIVREKIIDNLFSILTFTFVELVGLYMRYAAMDMPSKKYDIIDGTSTNLLGSVLIIVGVIGILYALNVLFTLKFCPKLVLIRSVKELINTPSKD